MSLLEIKNLNVRFGTKDKPFHAVKNLNLSMNHGEILGIVGESGSGKSVSMMAIMGLLAGQGEVSADSLMFDGQSLLDISSADRRKIIGKDLSMIFQDPMTSLNPSYTVGYQIAEVLKLHKGLRGKALRARCLELLELVGIPDAPARLKAYPHQLSGGMCQRVSIAMAMACEPKLLIADEPTTALDVTIQAQIIDLLLRLQKEQGMALIMITHDLAVVNQIAERVAVMYLGDLVEAGPLPDVFLHPQHSYTQRLLQSMPDARDESNTDAESDYVLEAEHLARHYEVSRGTFKPKATVKALADVSIKLRRGQTLAIVGESGSGKSTLARLLAMIEKPSHGKLVISGQDVSEGNSKTIKNLRKEVQMVFQNPYASLNPRRKIMDQLLEPLLMKPELSPQQRREMVFEMMQIVGLKAQHANRYPHMFSGGQRQRIAIARAMILKPDIVIADEPTSALDVSIQAQVLNLFMKLQADQQNAYVFISHDLAVVEHMADEVLVMYLGKTVELANKKDLYEKPLHPYTKVLLSATPTMFTEPRYERIKIKGELPSPLNVPSGCAFHKRCPFAQPMCSEQEPKMRELAGRQVACHFSEQFL
ncbi:ABC transporter ATP-binding protein [Brackiella oedipodis]|uniref:ABC transporter ATP-binding protein n=1 Tax=Brackiella oedipodis TaxID=124225 RepID=UPI000570C284|nr:ABC transporter ATP-binding protein [Brackiella oedipodis]